MKAVYPLLLLLGSVALPAQAQAPKPAPSTAAQALAVGRLFFTPEQREQLDSLRIKKVVASQAKEEPPPEIVTYEGVVRRTDGRTTVWVNNKPLTERELRDAPAIAGRIERDGTLRLQTGQAGPAMRLKVGQRAELSSGRIEERPATDTRNAIAGQRNAAAKPEDKEPPFRPAGPREIPDKLPLLSDSEEVKFIPMDPAMAAKLRALQESTRDRATQ